MRKGFCLLAAFAAMFSFTIAFAQNSTITGSVKNATTKEGVQAVSVTVKGGTQGTFTDANGDFKLNVTTLPVTLVFSSIGFETQEVSVSSASGVTVSFVPASSLGQEVVVSATRTPQRILESPVSIERIGIAAIRNAAEPNYYDLVKNLKGVDLTTSSLTFKTVSTRGFNGSGNLRFNQLTDGMDNQAPGLNFSVGSIIGPNELDIDNVELLQGASSALYGSGGTNGTMLITSKNPFKYQGLSLQIKQGVNHVNSGQHAAAPYYDWSFRWAKTIGQKFAFKLTGSYLSAQDWQANDTRNIARNNVFSSIKTGDRTSDPNYDGVNIFGDEASASMQALALAVRATVAQQLGANYNTYNTILNGLIAQNGSNLTTITAGINQTPFASTAQFLPFLIPTATAANNYSTVFTGTPSGGFVSRTGYDEKDLVDYHAYNVKFSGGLHYKITSDVEASFTSYFGTGTTVYTGADRYALKNLVMAQHKAEIKAKNWFLRGYTTQENSGDSYTATTAALYINNAWRSNSSWFQTYAGTFSGARLQGLPDAQAHAAARAAADAGRFVPGTDAFKNALAAATSTTIGKGGAKFDDVTDMYHFEGQYNLTDAIKFAEVLIGANYRIHHLNSHGSIFADTTGAINIREVGGYVQIQKNLLNDVLKLTGSVRYDKNENFEGRFTPRATALVKVAPNNSVRFSVQSAYRFPSNQDQYINLLTGGANRLIGGLAEFETFFKFNTNPAYTAESIVAYRNTVSSTNPLGNQALLQTAQFKVIKPERANSYELGYRGLLSKKFLLDAYGYYSIYKDFIGRTAVGRGQSADPTTAKIFLASPFTTDNYSFPVNTANDVKAIGWGISGNYLLSKGYEINANISSDKLRDVPANVVTFFNTPKLRYNIGIGNRDLGKGIGFNVQYRWQDKVYWEGTFGTGEVPSFGTLDAQISYKLPSIKSMIKFGGSNIANQYYRSAFGNPLVGGIYYLSFGYNVL